MPKTKFQEIIFTILMVIVMVYAMICYNISLETGGLSSGVFAAAFHELLIMGARRLSPGLFPGRKDYSENCPAPCKPGKRKSVSSCSLQSLLFPSHGCALL